MKLKNSIKTSGTSLIEIFIVISIIIILANFSLPYIKKLYRTYKFNEYALEIENLVKWAKITAIEKSINVSICKNNNEISVYNEETSRNPSCSGEKLKTLIIKDNWINLSESVAWGKEGLMFDPRGLAIFTGNICISDGEIYYKVKLQSNRGAITIEAGKGNC